MGPRPPNRLRVIDGQSRLQSLAEQVNGDAAAVRMVAMFPNVNALPRAERQLAILEC